MNHAKIIVFAILGLGAVALGAAYLDLRDTFKEKCRSDVRLSVNAGRIADALEGR